MEHQPKEIREFQTSNGRIPFKEWWDSFRDVRTKARITARLTRLAFGHYGDCRFVGRGIYELRIHDGPGYRIYFGQDQGTLIILLCGGDKSSQARDITEAQAYWEDYRGRQ